mgnify:CR=1 FL=1
MGSHQHSLWNIRADASCSGVRGGGIILTTIILSPPECMRASCVGSRKYHRWVVSECVMTVMAVHFEIWSILTVWASLFMMVKSTFVCSGALCWLVWDFGSVRSHICATYSTLSCMLCSIHSIVSQSVNHRQNMVAWNHCGIHREKRCGRRHSLILCTAAHLVRLIIAYQYQAACCYWLWWGE